MKILKTFILLLSIATAFGQQSVEPFFPTQNKEITITVDLSKVKDNRATGLLNQTDNVYIWMWGSSSESRSASPDLGPPGQNSFGAAYAPGKMTRVSANVWQIKIVPEKYYGTTKQIKWIGFLVKNGSGSAQTEDFTQTIYPDELNIDFFEPATKQIVVVAGQRVKIKVRASQKGNIALFFKKADFELKIDEFKDTDALEFDYVVPIGLNGTNQIVARVVTPVAQKETQLNMLIVPSVEEKKYDKRLKLGVNEFENKLVFNLLAPQKKFVHLIGSFNDFKLDDQYIFFKDGDEFWLEIDKSQLNTGNVTYQYLIEGTLAVADPFSTLILDPQNDSKISAETYPNLPTYPASAKGIVSVLTVNDPKYGWIVEKFQKPAAEDLVIYKLLVRDFSEKSNFQAVIDSISYFKQLGINCLELMPVMEFTNNDSWGYNPTFFTAVDKYYGTINQLKRLIDVFHQNGIAVVLDMVLNHADYEFPYVKMYWDGSKPTASSPFFNQSATHPFSVFFDFNHESASTKQIVKQINDFWLKEFKFDGYRFDLSKGFTQSNSGTDVGKWGNYDKKRIDTWKDINNDILKTDPTAYVILEHFADRNEEAELAANGMMVWGNEHGAFNNIIAGFTSSIRNVSYLNRQMKTPMAVNYMESQDEERLLFNAKEKGLSGMNYDIKTLPIMLERKAAAAAMLLMIPGPKMIWQFGEFGYDISINQNGRVGRKPLKWDYLKVPERARLLKTYAELNRLKTKAGFMKTNQFTIEETVNIKQITFDGNEKAVIIANFDLQKEIVELKLPKTGDYYDYFTGEKVNFTEQKVLIELQPGEFHIYSDKLYPISNKKIVPWPAFKKGINILSQEKEISNLTVFPNPAADFVTIKGSIGLQNRVGVKITNLNGRVLQESTVDKQQLEAGLTIPINHLRSGLYLINVGDLETIKFVKD